MSKILVAYFSATGTTADAAKRLADAVKGDLFEIRPAVPYTAADLDWTDKHSRSTLEMKDPASRPEVSSHVDNMDQYDTVFVGFPIWWYVAPTIINTFLDEYDFSGKNRDPLCNLRRQRHGQDAGGIEKELQRQSGSRQYVQPQHISVSCAVWQGCKRRLQAEHIRGKVSKTRQGLCIGSVRSPCFVGRFGGVNRDLSGRQRPYSL